MGHTITSFDVLPPVPAPKAPARPKPRQGSNRGRSSRYDAAQTTPENANHWANADGLSALSAANADVRYKLRIRSRYEEANSGHLEGLNNGRCNDTVGTGPRLQLSLPETFQDPDFGTTMTTTPPDAARIVERKWAEWCRLIDLPEDLQVMDLTETRDGEVFAINITNPLLPEDGPQLDVKLVEADQVTSVQFRPDDPSYVDGIQFDAAGNPVSYDVLRRHPGDTFNAGAWEYDTYPAARVAHLFRRKRPGQARGIPALTATLQMWPIHRRYTLATLGSAELGAMISGVIEQDDGATPTGGGDDPPEIEVMDQVPFARNALLTLSRGQRAKGFDSKQPVAEFGAFKGEILTECGRPINAPRNVSTGSSAEYNYSSGRLDHLPWQNSIRIRRRRVEARFLNRLFAAWLREAMLLPGYLPDGLPPLSEWEWEWYWDGFPSIDPVKDAAANQVLLESGQTTLRRVCAERGEHWADVIQQRAKEAEFARSLGLTTGSAVSIAVQDESGNRTEISRPASSEGGGDKGSSPTDKAAKGAAASGDVQATALNGAQVASLLATCDKLVAKQYTGPATDAILRGAFPGMDRDVIDTIVGELEDYTPPPPPDQGSPDDQEAAADG